MRSFISLNVNSEIKDEFYKIQNDVKKNIGESQVDLIRWEKRDKFHMTLFFLGDVPAEMLPKYDQLRKQKNGFAIASVINNSCSACGATLPPALQQKSRTTLSYCPTCKRIVYAN